MENPEEILHSLEEFAKMKPKDIPRELEEYLKFVAKTGDPVYQWSAIKSLFREKLINVITEFYESCTSIEIPPCPNVEMFNYDLMKNFILEKLDAFTSAPFTLQRICELLTSPKKEYSRIDKYMRALEKNILVVSTMEPGGRRTENGEGIMNGIESDHDHVPEPGAEINVEEMDDSPSWPQSISTSTNNHVTEHVSFDSEKTAAHVEIERTVDTYTTEKVTGEATSSSQEIVCVQYVSIEPLPSESTDHETQGEKDVDISVTITAVNMERINGNEVIHVQSTEVETAEAVAKKINEDVAEVDIAKKEGESESDAKMDTQPVESTLEESKEPTSTKLSDETSEEDSELVSDTIQVKAAPEKPKEETSLEQSPTDSEKNETETENSSISPENTVCESVKSPLIDETESSEISSSTKTEEDNKIINKEELKFAEDDDKEKMDDKEIELDKDKIEEKVSDEVDSTTKASGDNKVDVEKIKDKKVEQEEPTDTEESVVSTEYVDQSPVNQDDQKSEPDSSVSESSMSSDDDKSNPETPVKSSEEQEEKEDENQKDEISSVSKGETVALETTPEQTPSNKVMISEETTTKVKETPMDVDVMEETAPSEEKTDTTDKEETSSDLPE